LKTEYLRERHGERVITMATATPIANSITEAHVMQRYLRPDLLADAGVEHFDAWAATFGQTVTEIEMAPTGGGNYRMATRFARFQILCPPCSCSRLRDWPRRSADLCFSSQLVRRAGRADATTKYEKYERGSGCARRSVPNPRATARQG
jgi:hypothetical protein